MEHNNIDKFTVLLRNLDLHGKQNGNYIFCDACSGLEGADPTGIECTGEIRAGDDHPEFDNKWHRTPSGQQFCLRKGTTLDEFIEYLTGQGRR